MVFLRLLRFRKPFSAVGLAEWKPVDIINNIKEQQRQQQQRLPQQNQQLQKDALNEKTTTQPNHEKYWNKDRVFPYDDSFSCRCFSITQTLLNSKPHYVLQSRWRISLFSPGGRGWSRDPSGSANQSAANCPTAFAWRKDVFQSIIYILGLSVSIRFVWIKKRENIK